MKPLPDHANTPPHLVRWPDRASIYEHRCSSRVFHVLLVYHTFKRIQCHRPPRAPQPSGIIWCPPSPCLSAKRLIPTPFGASRYTVDPRLYYAPHIQVLGRFRIFYHLNLSSIRRNPATHWTPYNIVPPTIMFWVSSFFQRGILLVHFFEPPTPY